VHNYFPPPARSFVINLASPDVALRERSLEFAREGLELTAALDAPAYSVHAGFVTDPVGFDGTSLVLPEPASLDAQAEAERRLGDAIAILKERAGELGLRLLVENNVCVPEHRGKLLVQRGGEAAALVRAVGDGVGLLLDTGHLKVSAATLDFDWADFVDETAAFVGGFHLHDNDGSVDTHTPVVPGSWALEVVRRPEFADVPVVVEAKFDSLDELRRHVDWLRHELGAE